MSQKTQLSSVSKIHVALKSVGILGGSRSLRSDEKGVTGVFVMKISSPFSRILRSLNGEMSISFGVEKSPIKIM